MEPLLTCLCPWQGCLLVDSSEEYPMLLSDEALRRALMCSCTGWHAMLLCTPFATVIDSQARRKRSALSRFE